MSELPKEYIITEYELDEIFAFLQNPPMFDIPEFTLEIEHQIRSRPAPAPEQDPGFIPLSFMTMHKSQLFTASDVCALIEKHRKGAAAKAREKVQPFIDLARVLATKCDEMQDIMRRNKIAIDNVQEPMQKLAFTFYSEIGELAHMAGVVLEEYEESLREGAK